LTAEVELQVGFLSTWRKDYWVYLQILQGYLQSSQQQASSAAAGVGELEELDVKLLGADFIKQQAELFNKLISACLTDEGEIDAELAGLSKAPNASLVQKKNAMMVLNQIAKDKLVEIRRHVFGDLSSHLLREVQFVVAQQNKIKQEMAKYKNLVCRQQARQKGDGYEVVANAPAKDERSIEKLLADLGEAPAERNGGAGKAPKTKQPKRSKSKKKKKKKKKADQQPAPAVRVDEEPDPGLIAKLEARIVLLETILSSGEGKCIEYQGRNYDRAKTELYTRQTRNTLRTLQTPLDQILRLETATGVRLVDPRSHHGPKIEDQTKGEDAAANEGLAP
jgi:hypothetical protein